MVFFAMLNLIHVAHNKFIPAFFLIGNEIRRLFIAPILELLLPHFRPTYLPYHLPHQTIRMHPRFVIGHHILNHYFIYIQIAR